MKNKEDTILAIFDQLQSDLYEEREKGRQCLFELEDSSLLNEIYQNSLEKPYEVQESILDALEKKDFQVTSVIWQQLIEHPNAQYRQRAKLALQQENIWEIEFINQTLSSSPYPEIICGILEQIPHHPQKKYFLPCIHSLLEQEDMQIQEQVIKILERVSHPSSLSYLAKLTHCSKEIRLAAIMAMKKLAKSHHHSFFHEYLQDTDEEVRALAVWAYSVSARRRALNSLRSMLEKEKSSRVLVQVIYGLEYIQSDHIIATLIDFYTRNTGIEIRLAITQVLDRFPERKRQKNLRRFSAKADGEIKETYYYFLQRYDL